MWAVCLSVCLCLCLVRCRGVVVSSAYSMHRCVCVVCWYRQLVGRFNRSPHLTLQGALTLFHLTAQSLHPRMHVPCIAGCSNGPVLLI